MADGIAVLGSTGSIGRQTLEVAGHLGVRVRALAAAGNNPGLLLEQAKRFNPDIIAVTDSGAARVIAGALPRKTEVLHGLEGLCAAASQSGAPVTVAGVSGAAGLPAVISAIKAGKTVALANKEALVMAGRMIMGMSREYKTSILPVDGEHSAIFQCLQGQDGKAIKRLILTASGGPFLEIPAAELEDITPEQASAHPVWNMGAKISIDSSTMMNKGLEVIEASMLFGVGTDRIDVLIHPQSIIHSMVEFTDNSTLAQMGVPDMRIPIQYALTYPDRLKGLSNALDLAELGSLTFAKPDLHKFPCLSLAYDAARTGGTMTAVCNAANEAAVSLFSEKKVRYAEIPVLIERAMGAHVKADDMNLDNIYAADREAREFVLNAAGCDIRAC